jgi:DNA-binding NtrC family response regulator
VSPQAAEAANAPAPAGEGASVLVLEDDAALSEVLCEELSAWGYEAVPALGVDEAIALVEQREFDAALLDLQLPDGSGIDVLRRIAEEQLPTECVMLTGYAAVATAIEAMKLGAYDYLSKPAAMDELEVLLAKAVEKSRLRRENLALHVRLQQQPVRGLVTEDPGMKKLLATLARAAPSELPILIQGESGTGKELIARAIHQQSPRRGKPFIALNCAAVVETIIESELFGHERGAFTGAVDRKPGLFEVADRGVLFLDEVGDLSSAMQAKLLRVLETHEFMRVGGTRVVKADVRVVAASNKDLLELIGKAEFREDLYYRLNGVTLSLPALRERRGDIALLARHFLDQLGSGQLLGAKAVAALEAYRWPGNVRELEMVIRRAHLLCSSQELGPEDLPLHGPRGREQSLPFRPDMTLAEMEAEFIRFVLARHDGHRGNAARSLGIDPKTLYNKLR